MKNKLSTIFIIAIVTLMFFSPAANDIMNKVTKIGTVTIRTSGAKSYSNIWINKENVQVIDNKNYDEVEDGHFISNLNDSFLTFHIIDSKNPVISVIYTKHSADLKIENGFTIEEYDCYSETDTSVDIALTAGNKISCLRISILLFLNVFMFLLLYFSVFVMRKKVNFSFIQKLAYHEYSNKVLFAILWFLFFLYSISKMSQVENFVLDSGADTNWYWNVGNNLIKDGSFSIQNYSLSTANMSHRGYIVPFLFFALQKLAYFVKINPFIINSLFLTLISTILLVYILPSIAKITLKIKSLPLYQVLTSALLFLIFMRGHLLFPMSDLFAAFCIFYGILCFFRFYTREKAGNILFASAFFSLAAICKSNFKILLFIELFIILLLGEKNKWKNILISLVYFVIGVFIVTLPQISINYYRGEFGLLPSASDWYYMNQSLLEHGISASFQATQVWPHFLNNALGSLIRDGVYQGVSTLHIWDELLIFISYPLETFCWILSKAFMAIDIRTPFIYLVPIYSGIKGILFLILNSAVWSSIFISLFSKKTRKICYGTNNTILFYIITIALSLPLLIFSIEWRYFLPLYIWGHYTVSYIIPHYLTDQKKKNANLLRTFYIPLLVIMLLFIVTSITNYANYAWNNPGGFIF